MRSIVRHSLHYRLLWVCFCSCTLDELWGCNRFCSTFCPSERRAHSICFHPPVLSLSLAACLTTISAMMWGHFPTGYSYGGPSSKTQQTGRKLPLCSVLQINVLHIIVCTPAIVWGTVVLVRPISRVQGNKCTRTTRFVLLNVNKHKTSDSFWVCSNSF